MYQYYCIMALREDLSATQTEFISVTSEELTEGYSHDFLLTFKYPRYHNIKKIVLEKAIIPKTYFVLPTTATPVVSPYYKDTWAFAQTRKLLIMEFNSPTYTLLEINLPVGNYDEADLTTTIVTLMDAASAAGPNSWTYACTVDPQTGFLHIEFAVNPGGGAVIGYVDDGTLAGSPAIVTDSYVKEMCGFTGQTAFSTDVFSQKVTNVHGGTQLYLDVRIPRYDKLDKLMYRPTAGEAHTYAIPVVANRRQYFAYQSSDFSELKLDQRDSIGGAVQLRFTLKDWLGRNIDLWGGNVTYVLKIITAASKT